MRQFAGETKAAPAPTTAAPTGNAGLDMTGFMGTARTKGWLVTITTDTITDIFVWGALPAGVADDATDDTWGTHQDRHGAYPDGKIGSALSVGTHHRVIDDLGMYYRVAFTKSAAGAVVTVKVTEICETTRGG